MLYPQQSSHTLPLRFTSTVLNNENNIVLHDVVNDNNEPSSKETTTKLRVHPLFLSSFKAMRLCQVAIRVLLVWQTLNVLLLNEHVDGFFDVADFGREAGRNLGEDFRN